MNHTDVQEQQYLYMRDLVEMLGDCCEQWHTADEPAKPCLEESIHRHLSEFQMVMTNLEESHDNSYPRFQADSLSQNIQRYLRKTFSL